MINKADSIRNLRNSRPWRPVFPAMMIILIETLTGSAQVPAPEDSPVPKPAVEKTPAKAKVTAEAYEPAVDCPFGIGRITIPIDTEVDWKWYRDQPACVDSSNNKISYQAFQFQRAENDQESATFTAWFLLPKSPSREIKVSVTAGDEALVKDHAIKVQPHDPKNSTQCLRDFWLAFNENRSLSTSTELEEVNEYLCGMLARRMKFKPLAKTMSLESTSALERQFERSVGMLFGFTSVRLAMMELEPLPSQAYQQAAIRPLPPAMQIRSARINSFAMRNPEPLALHVPKECFYFRFPSVKHYLWVRELIQGWGGSLHDVVAVPAVDAQVRRRIEKQLAFDPLQAVEKNIDDEIVNAALIGLDTCFNEGTALGIVFQARFGENLSAILDEQREIMSRKSGVKSEMVTIGANNVQLLSSEDNQVRSFYLRKGKYHLLTNSEKLAALFLDAHKHAKSLGSLPEYRYALSQLEGQTRNAGVLYLPDPFFRNITAPGYRVEFERRRHAAEEIRTLKLAMAAARAESNAANDVPQLIADGFLPEHFGQRPDGSQAKIDRAGKVVDSLRGAPGSFLPVADIDIDLVTPAEYAAYQDFTRAYLREWRTVDPVLLTIAGKPDNEGKLDNVVVDVRITPYARQEYGVLARHLSTSTTNKTLRPAEGELLGLSLELNGYEPSFLRFGLVDADVEWEIERGEIIRLGDFADRSFAERNSYVLLTPFNRNTVGSARLLAESLQHRELGPTPQPTRRSRPPSKPSSNSPFLTTWIIAVLTGNPFLLSGENTDPLDFIGEREKYVRTLNPDIVRTVNQSFGFERGDRSAHVFMQMKGVKESNVLPYLEAVTWAESRRRSAADMTVLNRLSVDWGLSAQDARTLIEDALVAKLKCPMDGQYRLMAVGRAEEQDYWTSSLWQEPSLYRETSVPDEYDFRFLSWLREFSLDATLDAPHNTLSSHLELKLFDLPEMPAFPDVTSGQKELAIEVDAEENGTLIINRTDRPFQYRCRRVSGVWSKWYTLSANRAHRYRVDFSLELEYQTRHNRQRMRVRSNESVEFNAQTGELQSAR